MAAPTSANAPKRSLTRNEKIVKGAGIAVVVVVGARIGLPLLGKTLRAIFRIGRKRESQPTLQRGSSLPASGLGQQANQDIWHVLDAAAPGIPSDYKPVATAQLPCSVYEFYYHVLSGQSPWMEQQHVQIEGQYNFVRGAWTQAPTDLSAYAYSQDKSMLQPMGKSVFEYVLGPAGAGPAACSAGFARTLTFTQPKRPPATVDAECVQRQQFAVYAGDTLVMATAMNMLNIPFRECFTVNSVWEVRPSGPKQCTLNIGLKVNFVKGTLMSGIIRATSQRDSARFFKTLADNMVAMLRTAPPAPAPLPHIRRTIFGTPNPTPGRIAATLTNISPSQLPPEHRGLLAQTMPLPRQLRVLLVLFILVGSVLHQLSLHANLAHVVDELKLLRH